MENKKPIKKPKMVSKKVIKKQDDDVKIYNGADKQQDRSPSPSPSSATPKAKSKKRIIRKKSKGKKPKKTWVKVLQIILLILLLIGIVSGAWIARYVYALAKDLPEWDSTKMTGDLTTTFYDADGVAIAERHGVENRFPVDFDLVPQDLKNAFLATEDMEFYNHFGISIRGIVRSTIVNIREKRLAQGASTITQMLARNALIDADSRYQKQWDRKIKEILLAIQIESQYDKDEIFSLFLNTIPFGEGAYGVQAAAQTFFAKDIQDLNLAECALLAGLPQRPSGYNPFDYPDSAIGRRSQVLLNMENNGFITTAERNLANSLPLNLGPEPIGVTEGSYLFFIDHAMNEAESILEDLGYDPDIYRNGYTIHTTMHNAAQTKIEELYEDPENFPEDMNDEPVQAAMVVINHQTGAIQALMGGREYSSQRGFNRATSPDMNRQPGSALKPISVYGPALEYGSMSTGTVIDDIPVSIPTNQGPYEPTNYDGRYRGLVTMREAIRNSINVPAIKVLNEIGTITGYNFASNLGIPFEENEKYNLSIALGGMTYGTNPLELARAYGAFANQGILVDSYSVSSIETNDGTIIYEANPQKIIVMSEETAYMMSDMLQTAVNYGTGTNARIPGWQTAGKTGTTQLPTSTPAEKAMFENITGNRDAWFAGYTSQYTSAVWMGFDNTDAEHYLNRSYGGKYPALLFQQTMEIIHQDLAPIDFVRPEGVVSIAIDQKSGLLPSNLTPSDFIVRELFNKNNVPKEISDVWVEAPICSESKMLGTYLCPDVITKVFLKRDNRYSPTVLIRDIEKALARYGVSKVEALPPAAVENLVLNIIPEDYVLMAPAEYCNIHYNITAPNTPGSLLPEEEVVATPGVNPIYWQFFPQNYRPSGYLDPNDTLLDPDAEPIDPMVPPEDLEIIINPNEGNEPIEGENVPQEISDINIFEQVSLTGSESGAKLEWVLEKDYKNEDWIFNIWKQASDDDAPYSLVVTEENKFIDSDVSPNKDYYYTIFATNEDATATYQSLTYKIVY